MTSFVFHHFERKEAAPFSVKKSGLLGLTVGEE